MIAGTPAYYLLPTRYLGQGKEKHLQNPYFVTSARYRSTLETQGPLSRVVAAGANDAGAVASC